MAETAATVADVVATVADVAATVATVADVAATVAHRVRDDAAAKAEAADSRAEPAMGLQASHGHRARAPQLRGRPARAPRSATAIVVVPAAARDPRRLPPPNSPNSPER
jgi:hypothetical protein